MSRNALEEISSLTSNANGKCLLGRALDSLDPSLREGVTKALDLSSALPASAISKWFKNEGLPLSDQTVLRHRKGTCVCG